MNDISWLFSLTMFVVNITFQIFMFIVQLIIRLSIPIIQLFFKVLGGVGHEAYKSLNKRASYRHVLILGPGETIQPGATYGDLYDYSQTASLNELTQFTSVKARDGDFWLGKFVSLCHSNATTTKTDVWLPHDFLLQHLLIVGNIGSGKTELMLKSAESLMKSGHLVFVDAAGFLGNRLYPAALNVGSKLCCWDLNATSNKVVWNFLEELEKFGEERDIRAIAQAIYGQYDDRDQNAPFWKLHTNWLAGLIGISVEARRMGVKVEPSELVDLVVDRNKVVRILKFIPEANQKWGAILHGYLINSHFNHDSGFLLNKLTPFQDSKVKSICDGNSQIFINEALNRSSQKYTIVVGQSLADGDFGASLAAVMVSYIMKLMYRRMLNQGMGQIPTYMICDEARRLENIDYEQLTGIGRNASAGIVIMCQSMDQFSDRQLVAIQNNCKTQLFLQGVSYKSAEWMSKQIGEYPKPSIGINVKSGIVAPTPGASKTITYPMARKLGIAEITTRPPVLQGNRSALIRITSSRSQCTKPFLTDYSI